MIGLIYEINGDRRYLRFDDFDQAMNYLKELIYKHKDDITWQFIV